MGWETVLGTRPALRVLVVGDAGRLAASDDVLATRVPDVPAALSALVGSRFDCILLELAGSDPDDARTLTGLRERAGAAAVVVVSEPASEGAASLEDLADLVLGRDELAGAGVGALRQASERARLVRRLRSPDPSSTTGPDAGDTTGTVLDLDRPVVPGPLDRRGAGSGAARPHGTLAGAAMFTLGDDGRVTSWTDGAADLYGYTAAEVVGRDAAVLHPLSSTDVGPSLTAGRESGGVRDHDTICRTRDGRLLPLTLDAAPQVDATGKPVGWVVVARPAVSPGRVGTGLAG